MKVYWFCGKFWYFAENSGKLAENSGMDTSVMETLSRQYLTDPSPSYARDNDRDVTIGI